MDLNEEHTNTHSVYIYLKHLSGIKNLINLSVEFFYSMFCFVSHFIIVIVPLLSDPGLPRSKASVCLRNVSGISLSVHEFIVFFVIFLETHQISLG